MPAIEQLRESVKKGLIVHFSLKMDNVKISHKTLRYVTEQSGVGVML
jgi:hypothetical protein